MSDQKEGIASPEQIEYMSNMMGTFVVDHAAFVEEWTKKNLKPGNTLALAVLTTGMGTSTALFCKHTGGNAVDPSTMKKVFMRAFDQEMAVV